MTAFVLLHYIAEHMTSRCIDTIRKFCETEDYHIVIVDNFSPNGSGKRLFDLYSMDKDCTVILNDSNLGFGGGNNIGYVYAKRNLKAEYIVIMNTDIFIQDSFFCERVSKLYEKYHYAVLGPDIFYPGKNWHQNPYLLRARSKSEVEKAKFDVEKILKNYSRFYWSDRAKKILKVPIHAMMSKIYPGIYARSGAYVAQEIINPVLHGACLIFSKCFIEKEEMAFNPNTFLFWEEDILHNYCMRKNYLMLYSNSISVVHMADSSINASYKSDYKKRKDREISVLNSINVLLQEMETK